MLSRKRRRHTDTPARAPVRLHLSPPAPLPSNPKQPPETAEPWKHDDEVDVYGTVAVGAEARARESGPPPTPARQVPPVQARSTEDGSEDRECPSVIPEPVHPLAGAPAGGGKEPPSCPEVFAPSWARPLELTRRLGSGVPPVEGPPPQAWRQGCSERVTPTPVVEGRVPKHRQGPRLDEGSKGGSEGPGPAGKRRGTLRGEAARRSEITTAPSLLRHSRGGGRPVQLWLPAVAVLFMAGSLALLLGGWAEDREAAGKQLDWPVIEPRQTPLSTARQRRLPPPSRAPAPPPGLSQRRTEPAPSLAERNGAGPARRATAGALASSGDEAPGALSRPLAAADRPAGGSPKVEGSDSAGDDEPPASGTPRTPRHDTFLVEDPGF